MRYGDSDGEPCWPTILPHITKWRVGGMMVHNLQNTPLNQARSEDIRKPAHGFRITSEGRKPVHGNLSRTQSFSLDTKAQWNKITSAWIVVQRKQRNPLLEVSSLSRSTTQGVTGSKEEAWLSQVSKTMSGPPQVPRPYRGGWAPGSNHKPIFYAPSQ